MGVSDDFYTTTLKDGRTFTCSRLVLQKTGGICPVHGDVVDEELHAKSNARKQARGI